MSLVTRCPKCSSAFRVVVDQLRLHDGLVRCGACSHIFDGFACLDNELPTLTNKVTDQEPEVPTVEEFLSVPRDLDEHQTPRATPLQGAAPVVMRGRAPATASTRSHDHPDQHDASESWTRNDAGSTLESTSPILRGLADDPVISVRESVDDRPEPRLFRDAQDDVPSPVLGEPRLRVPQMAVPGVTPPPFMEREGEPGILTTIAWAVACLLALLLLLLQVLYVYRNEIGTAIPSMRSPLNLMCARLGCEVSYVRQLERITFTASALQQTDVAGADGTPPRYLLTFSMRNRYDKPQPWPSLLLSLTDAGGTVVVRKMVLPHEYLPRTLIDQPFAAGQELNLELPLVVRGAQVQGFQLEKFFP